MKHSILGLRELMEDGTPESKLGIKALGDRYEILSKLGEGASGSVYSARDKILCQNVAVKSFRLHTSPYSSTQDHLRSLFLGEAQLAAKLRHPNIVMIHDIVSTPNASLIIMDLVDGETLQSILASKKRLAFTETIELLGQVASALDYAHKHKVIHRNLHPGNILLTSSNEVIITDFGVARTDSPSDLTTKKTIAGTPDYMSPELVKGKDVDNRSDLFSLGCVLHECLTGEKPFQGGSAKEVLLHIACNDAAPIFDGTRLGLPPGLSPIIARALDKDPEERYQNGAALMEDLRALPRPVSEATFDSVKTKPTGSAPANDRNLPPYLRALREEVRPLRLANPNVTQRPDLSPDEAFILSRVDGQSPPRKILNDSPFPEKTTVRTLLNLIELGIIKLQDAEQEQILPTKPDMSSVQGTTSLDIADAPEIPQQEEDPLLQTLTAPQQDEDEIIVIEEFPNDDDLVVFEEYPIENDVLVDNDVLVAEEPTTGDDVAQQKNDERQQEEIFLRAKNAYLFKDYWQTIQLCRHAIRLWESEAKYHHLLGLALAQNENWKDQAEESLLKAAALNPRNPEHFKALGQFYETQGIPSQARRMLDIAASLP